MVFKDPFWDTSSGNVLVFNGWPHAGRGKLGLHLGRDDCRCVPPSWHLEAAAILSIKNLVLFLHAACTFVPGLGGVGLSERSSTHDMEFSHHLVGFTVTFLLGMFKLSFLAKLMALNLSKWELGTILCKGWYAVVRGHDLFPQMPSRSSCPS